MRQLSDTCECDDARHHSEGECSGDTITFRTVNGVRYALCRDCSNNKHRISAEGADDTRH